MGHADADLYLDARRLDDGNLGTAPGLDPALERDVVAVQGPGVWMPPLRSGGAASGNNLAISTVGADVADRITITYRASHDLSNQPFVTRGRWLTGNAGIELSLTAPGWVRAFWRLTDGYATGDWAETANGATHVRSVWVRESRTFHLEEFASGAWAAIGTPLTVSEDLFSGDLEIRARQTSLGMTGTIREFYVDVDDVRYGFDDSRWGLYDSADPAGSLALDSISQATDGPQTTVVPAGRAVIVNADHDDLGNKVTTGEGVASEAVAFFTESAGTLDIGYDERFGIDVDDAAVITARIGPMAAGTPQQTLWGQRHVDSDPGPWWATGVLPNGRRLFRLYIGLSGGSWAQGAYTTPSGDPLDAGGWCRVSIPPGDNPTLTFSTAPDSDTVPDDAAFVVAGTATPATTRSLGTRDAVIGGRGPGSASEALQTTLRHIRFEKNGELSLDLTRADMARAAEGSTSFLTSTGQQVNVNGDVQFTATAFHGPTPVYSTGGIATNYLVADELFIVDADDFAFEVFLPDSTAGQVGETAEAMGRVGSTLLGAALRFGTAGVPQIVYYDTVASQFVSVTATTLVDSWKRLRAEYDGTNFTFYASTEPVGAFEETEVVADPGNGPSLLQAGQRYLIGSNNGSNLSCQVPIGGIRAESPIGAVTAEFDQVDIARAATAEVGAGERFTGRVGTFERVNDGALTGAAPLVIGADESALIGYVGTIGNQTGATPDFLALGTITATTAALILERASVTDDVQARVRMVDGTGASVLAGGAAPTEFAAYLAVVDRTVSPPLLRNLIVHADGTFDETTVDITGVGAIVPTEGITALSGLPGALSALLFRNYGTAAMPSPAELAAEFAPGLAPAGLPNVATANAEPIRPMLIEVTP